MKWKHQADKKQRKLISQGEYWKNIKRKLWEIESKEDHDCLVLFVSLSTDFVNL